MGEWLCFCLYLDRHSVYNKIYPFAGYLRALVLEVKLGL
jgi:hypothetical protein